MKIYHKFSEIYFIVIIFLCINILLNTSCSNYELTNIQNRSDNSIDLSRVSIVYKIISDPNHSITKYYKTEKDFIKEILNEIQFKNISETNTTSKDLYLKIDIKFIGPTGAGIDFITGLSFGIIPTYTPKDDQDEILISLYRNGVIIYKKKYLLSNYSLNWLYVTPLTWGPFGNDYRLKRILKTMLMDFIISSKLFVNNQLSLPYNWCQRTNC